MIFHHNFSMCISYHIFHIENSGGCDHMEIGGHIYLCDYGEVCLSDLLLFIAKWAICQLYQDDDCFVPHQYAWMDNYNAKWVGMSLYSIILNPIQQVYHTGDKHYATDVIRCTSYSLSVSLGFLRILLFPLPIKWPLRYNWKVLNFCHFFYLCCSNLLDSTCYLHSMCLFQSGFAQHVCMTSQKINIVLWKKIVPHHDKVKDSHSLIMLQRSFGFFVWGTESSRSASANAFLKHIL